MELKDLRHFQRIADLGSLRSASDSLGLSQPALSKSLRRLETSLGVTLFERRARGVTLTSMGKALYMRNAAFLQTAEEIPRELNDLKVGKKDLLRVGTVPGLVDQVMCPILARSLETGIPSSFALHVQLTGALLRELSAGHLDFALAVLQDDVPAEFAYSVIGEQTAHVVGRIDHPLRQKSFDASELMHYPWLLPSKEVTLRNWVEKLFSSLHLQPPELYVETDSSPLAFAALIANSDVLTVMTKDSLLSRGGAGLGTLEAPAISWNLQVALYWRRSAYVSASMRHLRQELTRAFAHRRAYRAQEA
jgi:DNA-binding transcriptional LysR family regulator